MTRPPRPLRPLHRVHPLRLIAGVLLLALTSPVAEMRAQDGCANGRGCDHEGIGGSTLGDQAAVLGLNALVGGVAGGLAQGMRGGSFRDGFVRGAAGGAVIYAGKRVAVEPFDGAGFLGREVAAVGGSMVRNAGGGRPLFSEVVLPLGPSRIYLRPGQEAPVRLQLDAPALVMLGLAALDDRYSFDAGASLSAGAPVFRQRDHVPLERWAGRSRGGLILLRGRADSEPLARRRQVAAHERVHVLQYDQGFLMLGAPLEEAVLPLLPGGAAASRYVDFGLELPFWALAHRVIDYQARPWEKEAGLLSGTDSPEVSLRAPGEMVMGSRSSLHWAGAAGWSRWSNEHEPGWR